MRDVLLRPAATPRAEAGVVDSDRERRERGNLSGGGEGRGGCGGGARRPVGRGRSARLVGGRKVRRG